MAQNINLYARPNTAAGGLTGQSAFAVAYGVVAISMAGVYVNQWQSLREMREELPRIEAQSQRIQRVIAKVPSPNAAQAESLLLEEREVAALETIAVRLTSGAVGRAGGFTESLRALGRTATEGVWLTGLRLDNGGNQLFIEGRALDAARIPTLLKALRGEPLFVGVSFTSLDIKPGEEGGSSAALRFRITSGNAVSEQPVAAKGATAAVAEAIASRHARRDAAFGTSTAGNGASTGGSASSTASTGAASAPASPPASGSASASSTVSRGGDGRTAASPGPATATAGARP